MRTLYIIILLIGFSSFAFAVNEAPEVTTIEKTRDFTVLAKKNDDGKLIEQRFKIKVTGKYDSKNGGTLKISIADDTTEELNYPLDFYYYQLEMDALFQNKQQDFIISHQSHLEIFTWLSAISGKPDLAPLAGTLHLSSYVLVYDKFTGKTTKEDYDYNMKMLYDQTDEARRIDGNIKKLKDSVKNENEKLAKLDKNDTNYDSTKISINTKIEIISQNINKSLDSLKKPLKSLNDLQIFKIEDVQIQFEGGFIERIQVTVNMGDYLEIFENTFPIGFSSIPNFANFSRTKLFARGNKNGQKNFILLSNVIQRYDNELQLKTKDYSPADTTIRVDPTLHPLLKLHKLQSRYIIDGKAFTDVNGFSETSPNGLVQIELSRRFLLNTERQQRFVRNNAGFFTYLDARVNYSKIENKLKGLYLRNELVVENQTVVSPSYATNLDFLRYENLSISTELNLLIFDSPHYKLSYFIDLGLRYGHTPVKDSNNVMNIGQPMSPEVDFSAHSFTLYPKIWVKIFAERRYGMHLAYQFNFRRVLSNNNFKQVLSYSGKGNDLTTLTINPSARYFHTVEAFAYFDANPQSRTGKLFALARFHFQHRDVNTFFPQILIGYAFNIYN